MKNHRGICAARHAGVAEYEGLSTRQCENWMHKYSTARYCAAHVPSAFSSVASEEGSSATSAHGLHQVAFITEKRRLDKTHFIN